MTQAKQNKERFIYRRSARSLVSLSLSFSFPSFHPFLFLPFSLSPFPSPRRAPSLSRYFFRPPRTHQLVLTVSFARSHSTPSPCPTYTLSLPLSVSLSYLPIPLFLSPFLSLFPRRGLLARSLTCAQMKSIKMLGATSRQSCSTPTPCFPFIPLAPVPGRPPPQPPPNSHSYAVRNRENPYVRSRYLPTRARTSNFSTPVYHRRATVWVGCKVRTRRCVYVNVPMCVRVYVCA